MMAADAVIFNSDYHLRSFFQALPPFLKHFPEYNELDSAAELWARSHVLPVGIDLQRLIARHGNESATDPPLIIWNHRWEYDKNPAEFFSALYDMEAEGMPFRLAVCGRSFRRSPGEFHEAQERLGHRVSHFGYATEERYRQLLWQATITVSTAVHEFFGISALEAIYCHNFPILPGRLTYPEMIPEHFHERCLYHDSDGLRRRLRWAITHQDETAAAAAELARSAAAFSWTRLAPIYDKLFSQIASGN